MKASDSELDDGTGADFVSPCENSFVFAGRKVEYCPCDAYFALPNGTPCLSYEEAGPNRLPAWEQAGPRTFRLPATVPEPRKEPGGGIVKQWCCIHAKSEHLQPLIGRPYCSGCERDGATRGTQFHQYRIATVSQTGKADAK